MFENFPLQVRDERQLKALTGTSIEQFERLEQEFQAVYEEERKAVYDAAVKAGKRKRKPGGGSKGVLNNIKLKLFFLLYYLKVYPTFDVLGSTFGLSRSKSCENVHKLMPLLHKSLLRLRVLPHREFESVEDFSAAFNDAEALLLDATERAHQRPINDEKQSELYSGKQKDHTVKNTVISTKDKAICFLGHTMSGCNHDFAMLKEEFPPDKAWFKDILMYLDLGYTGILNQYDGDNIQIPHRKPRKSKNNPNPQLTEEEREHNRIVGKIRIFVENALAGLKRYKILVHDFRNKKDNFVDDTIAICAGLWNMMLGAKV